jgi:hypothetical protein
MRHHRGYVGGFSVWYPHWKQQLAQVVALSGGLYWGFATWCLAWLGCAFAANGARLAVPGTRWGWARFRMGLLGGATALAAIADLPWWIGLATVPWLLIDPRPALRSIGVSCLVLSIMTPFYHPYARLWLPLDAAGWLITAGLIVRLGPFARLGSDAALISPNVDAWAPGPSRLRVIAMIVCVCLGLAREVAEPVPIPLARFFQPSTCFRDLADNLVTSPPVFRGMKFVLNQQRERHGHGPPRQPTPSAPPPAVEIHGLRVLARRALVFYLVIQGKLRVQIEPDGAGFLREGRPDEWALLDRVLTRGDPVAERLGSSIDRPRGWYPVRWFSDPLDPVTLLDVYPGDVYRDPWLLAPRRGSVMLLAPVTKSGETSE